MAAKKAAAKSKGSQSTFRGREGRGRGRGADFQPYQSPGLAVAALAAEPPVIDIPRPATTRYPIDRSRFAELKAQ